jgi:hypothetical protein
MGGKVGRSGCGDDVAEMERIKLRISDSAIQVIS